MCESKNKYFQLDHRTLIDKLSILYNSDNSTVVLWNKYQIFVYEEDNFEKPILSFDNIISVSNLIVLSNHFVCLDYDGQIHIIPVKLKSPSSKKIKGNVKTHYNGVVAVARLNQDHWYSLKVSENGKWQLCLCKMNGDLVRSVKITNMIYKEGIPKLQDIILRCFTIREEYHHFLKYTFNLNHIDMYSDLVIIAFDHKVYFGLHNRKMDDVTFKVMFVAPLDIMDLQVYDSNVFIVLKLGTFVKVPLIPDSLSKQCYRYKSEHLNVKLHKIIFSKNDIIFTDGIKLWKSMRKDQKFEKDISKWKEFNIPLPKDIIQVNGKITCVTYTNKVYVINEDVEDIYLTRNVLPNSEYKNADKVLSGIKEFYPIVGALKKNEELCNNLQFEKDLLVAMILSTKEKIVQDMLGYQVLVYEKYADALKEHKTILLSSETSEYFEPNTILFLVKVTIIDRITLNHFVKGILQNLKLHLTFSSESCSLKTTSLGITSFKETMNALISVPNNNLKNVTVNINLVPILPGAIDLEQKLPIVLSKKQIILRSEHFIKTTISSDHYVKCLQTTSQDIKESVLKMTKRLHTSLFNFIDSTRQNNFDKDYKFCVKLPQNYLEIFCSEASYSQYFSKVKSLFLLNKLSSSDFLKTRNPVVIQVQELKVNVQINKDDEEILSITSKNMIIAYEFRNFFSKLLYGNYEKMEGNKEFVPQASYAIIESLERSLKWLKSENSNEETVLDIAEQFDKNVIARLPL